MPGKGIEELRPALIAIGFLGMPAALFDFQLKWETLLAGFSAAFVVYLADHLLPAKNTFSWLLIGLCTIPFLIFTWLSRQFSLPGLIFYIGLALCYELTVFPQGKRLQDFPLPRVFAIVTGWAALPLLLKPFPVEAISVNYLLGMCGYMLPAVIWSDLADTNSDFASGRKTWTQHRTPQQRNGIIVCSLLFSLACFSAGRIWIMLPAPLLYLFSFKVLNRNPKQSDWFLLWPLMGYLCYSG